MKVRIKRIRQSADFSSLQYRVTPFKAAGIYPRGAFRSPAAAFVADDEVVFAVTHCSTWRSQEHLPYSEVDWMNPELVRMLGSLKLCERFTDRRCDGQFFGDFYTQRIQTFHPGSRFGDSPFAAIAIDDRIHLRQALPGLFGYLISGTHSPDWLERIAEARSGEVRPM